MLRKRKKNIFIYFQKMEDLQSRLGARDLEISQLKEQLAQRDKEIRDLKAIFVSQQQQQITWINQRPSTIIRLCLFHHSF